MNGKVTFVGVGCGDPRLLTLRAVEVLEEADVALVDEGLHPDVLARLRSDAHVHVACSGGEPDARADQLVLHAARGLRVVRLVHGDPIVLGESAREAEQVAKRGVAIELVPGIDWLAAACAFGGVTFASASGPAEPVTSVRFDARAPASVLPAQGPLVMVVAPAEVQAAAERLLASGRAPTARVTRIADPSRVTERVDDVALGVLAEMQERPSAAGGKALRGEPASVELLVLDAPSQEALRWRSRLPLYGRRVLVTRARSQADRMVSRLRALGAEPIVAPAIAFEPPSEPGRMVEAVSSLARYGCIVFTSANGVERLWAEVRRQGKDARAFSGAMLAAIGPGTATALEACGVSADLVPSVHKGEDLAEALLASFGAARPRVLLARAEVARDVVPDTLRAAGCEVDVVPVYRTVPPAPEAYHAIATMLAEGALDCVTFTSTSTVDNVCDALGPDRAASLLASTCVASIGPITTASAERRGLRVDVSAEPHTIEGLIEALVAHLARVSPAS